VKNITERFQRAKLFADATQLHMRLEHWMNVESMRRNDMVDMGMSQTTLDKMESRVTQLTAAWEAAGEARRALYDCP